MTAVPNVIRWTDIWKLFDPDEQQDACLCLLEHFKENRDDVKTLRLLERLAEGTGSRSSYVENLVRSNPDKAAALMRARAPALFKNDSWVHLFTKYYPRRRRELLCTFLDLLDVQHDANGNVLEDFPAPDEAKVFAAVESLLRTYSVREVGRYLAVLELHADGWNFVVNQRDRLLQLLEGGQESAAKSAANQAEVTTASSIEFGVLDRVLIEQIVRAAMEIEGSLDARLVEELVETVTRLNEKWVRAYFHLGFMDVLLSVRTPRFDHPGDNHARRGWYLAGVIAGLGRSNDLDGLIKVLDGRNKDLAETLSDPGGPGASIARTAFRRIADAGRITDAILCIRGQVGYLGLEFAEEVLDVATAQIRQAQFEGAKVIVDELSRHSLIDEDNDRLLAFRLALSRRRAQCLQAAGDFEGAEREYRELLRADEDKISPDLLADLGLVKGRFRSLAEVRIPEGTAERVNMREALARGEEHFKRAAERFGIESPKAAYPLALLGYLRWCFASERDREERRDRAAQLASAAVSSILASEFAAVYRDYGALGQSQFMLAVTRMNSFEDVQGREALAAWQTITSEAGRFPMEDLKRLVDALDMYGADIADPIVESIWEFRQGSALEILRDGPWMTRSSHLREALTTLAQSEQTPRVERIRLWKTLIPQLIKSNDQLAAEEGLSALESLAEGDADCATVLEFLANAQNYDPVWKESDAAWARLYLLRRLGKDQDCVDEVRRLFYMVRDNHPWEAEQLLEAADEWNLDQAFRHQLRSAMPRLESETSPGIEQRLKQGERVRIVFIGGNEIQARYDATIKEELRSNWPGLEVHFEHTAWSPNWGRDLDRLKGLANEADAVVLMYMMRTLLGRRLRAALKKPWIPCTATGKGAILSSVRRAAVVGLEKRVDARDTAIDRKQ